MSLTTTNYGFIKPELTDAPPDITAMNPNWDKLDTNLKTLNDSKVAFPNKLFSEESTDPTRTIYLSSNGSDSNNGSESSPMKTLRGAIAKYGGNGYLKLYLADGEYTDSSDEGLINISGCSFISIFSTSGSAANVVIKVPLYFRGVPFYLENITVDVSASASDYCVCARSASFALSGCILNGSTSATNGIMSRYGAVGYLSNVEINSCKNAVRADTSGQIFTTTLKSTSNNTCAYNTVGGIISITGDNLLATTTYSRSGSGVIITNGVAPAYTYGTTDLTAGTSTLATGVMHLVYE